jgi:hypothetical protein
MPWARPSSPPDAPPESPEELIFKRHPDGVHVETPWWPVIQIAGSLLRQEMGRTIRRTERDPNLIRIKAVNRLAFYSIDSVENDIYRCHLLYGE